MKVGGLEFTEDQNKDVRYLKAEIVSVGDKVTMLAPGNIIRYDRHAGHGIESGVMNSTTSLTWVMSSL